MTMRADAATTTLFELRSETVTLVFKGRLDGGEGARLARRLAAVLAQRPLDLVWDVRDMRGYDPEARESWQRELWPVRGNIRSVTVLGGDAFVRLGARALCFFLHIPCRFS